MVSRKKSKLCVRIYDILKKSVHIDLNCVNNSYDIWITYNGKLYKLELPEIYENITEFGGILKSKCVTQDTANLYDLYTILQHLDKLEKRR